MSERGERAPTPRRPADGPLLNPFDPGFFADPYRQYGVARTLEPVHETPFGPWVLFRHRDVLRLLRDPATSVEDRNAAHSARDELLAASAGARVERGTRAMLNLDPPDHTRLRRLVSKAFTPRSIAQLRPRIQAMVDDLLDAVRSRAEGRMDVIADLAFPLPFAVINEMLGMPPGDRDQLREWSHTLTRIVDLVVDPDQLTEIFEASDRIAEVAAEAIAWKRTRPDDDDLLARLLAAEDDGDALTDRELIDQVTLLYLAGHETTVNLIGNGTLALLRHPDQLNRLRADPSLGANAVEELLRYDSPVQFSRRIALAPIDLGDRWIEPGAMVLTGLGAANRDPERWGPTADQLDLGRADANQHLSFGMGVHHCLGAALARVEAQVAIGTLVRRFPNLELAADEPAWNGRMVLRGLDELPVTV